MMRLKDLLSSWKFYLALATLVAILIRSIPAWVYSAWGNDFGIYYSITIQFLKVRNPFYDYPAIWGSSGYGSFPMLYLIILFFHIITGISPQILLLKIPPIIGGLTVIPLYFISYALTKNRGFSIIAAFLLAINPIHVYQTSMPYFLTVGHLFLLISIYYFIRWQENEKYLFYLSVSSALLLISHHLSTYIFVISILGISFIIRVYHHINYQKNRDNFLFIGIYSAFVFTYWLLRVPGMYGFLSSVFHHAIPWYFTIALYFIFLFLAFILSERWQFKRESSRIIKFIKKVNIVHFFIFSLAISIGFFLFLMFVGLRGYYVAFTSILYSIPFMLTLGFMGVGAGRLYKLKNGYYYLLGWLGAISFSMILGAITWSALEPWRHIEYLMEPLSIVGALGIETVLHSKAFKTKKIKKRIRVTLGAPAYVITHRLSPESPLVAEGGVEIPTHTQVRDPITFEEIYPLGRYLQIIFVSVVIFIILMTGATAFLFMGQIEHPRNQGVSPVVMSGINWLVLNGNKNYTVATDHLIGTILQAKGFNSSYEYDYKIWNATAWQDCLDELAGLNNSYPPVGYVVISKSMYTIGVYGFNESQNPLQPPVIMGDSGYEKFKKEPFELKFRNESINNGDWVEVYWVNWTYIREHIQARFHPKSFAMEISKNSENDYTPWYSHRDFLNFSISCSREFSLSLFTSIPAIFMMNSRDFR